MQQTLMYNLPIFQRVVRMYGLHPLFPYPKHKWVTWGFHSLTLKQLPSVFFQTAQLSGKAGVKTHTEIPENVRDQVQQVLQDYLYNTRGFNFADARNISLNAPCFIHKMLSSVLPKKHVTRALEKHLLYHPINEFEPFLESIGIQPSDIHSLLPSHQLFLKENRALLATVSTLSNIGFPRQELGKLYKAYPELFICSTGELQKKLQFYENLGVSKASLVRVLICCPSLLNDDTYRKFKAVAIGSNGLQGEKIKICCLMEKNLHIHSSILEKLMLLMGIGCPWEEISKLFHTKSDLLNNCSEKDLCSTIEFLSSLGLQKEDIGSIILKCPEIFKWEVANSMEISAGSAGLDQNEAGERIHLHRGHLIKLLECTVGTVFEKSDVSVLIREHLKSRIPLTALSNVRPEIFQRIQLDGKDVVDKVSPENFQSTQVEERILVDKNNDLVVGSFKHNHSASSHEMQICENLQNRIPWHKLNILLKVGLAENSQHMLNIANRLHCGGDKLQERFNYFLELGLPFPAVCNMVRSSPDIFNCSLDSIQKKVVFLCSCVCNPLQALQSYPRYLYYSLEHRIMPRYKMGQWLKTKNMLKSKMEFSFASILQPSEKIFMLKYVSRHPEGGNYYRQCKLGNV